MTTIMISPYEFFSLVFIKFKTYFKYHIDFLVSTKF